VRLTDKEAGRQGGLCFRTIERPSGLQQTSDGPSILGRMQRPPAGGVTSRKRPDVLTHPISTKPFTRTVM
jgi:hypothetical protein